MKYAVYIITMVLAVFATLLAFGEILREEAQLFQFRMIADMPMEWHEIVINLIQLCFPLLFAISAIVQMFKSMPRIMLLFNGAAALAFVNYVATGRLSMLCLLAAGLLAALYELVRYGRRMKAQPVRPVKRGLLIAAGVVAGLRATLAVTNTFSLLFERMPEGYAVHIASGITGMVGMAALAVFCFLKNWRVGEFLRMFLVGASLLGVLVWPLDLLMLLEWKIPLQSILISVLSELVSIFMVLFVLVHAAKHRREDVAPPEPEPSEPNAAIAA